MAGEIDRLEIQIEASASSAAESIKALADSIESLGKNETKNATEGLQGIASALGSMKGTRSSSFTRSIENLANAFSRLNEIGGIEKSIEVLDSVENLKEALSGLSSISRNIQGFKVVKSFDANLENLSLAISHLNEIGGIEKSVEILDSVENLKEALSGLSSISQNIQGLKVGKSFDTNLENLSLAISHLNEIGDTSQFAGGVSAISESVERLNNIEIGQGFTNIVQMSTKWADALERINSVQLGSEFSQGIARVARAAEILNEVDFSGFTRMNEALAALPDNVRISFGASSEEVQELTSNLAALQSTVGRISQDIASRRNSRTTANSAGQDNEQEAEPYWLGNATRDVIEQANAWNKNRREVAQALEAYQTLGMEAPAELQSLAGAYGLVEEETANFRDRVRGALETVVSGVNQIASSIAKVGGTAITASIKAVFAPITALGNKFKETAAKAGQFLASIKRIAMYRVIRSALKALSEGFQEGRENLYQYSVLIDGQFAKSMDMAATSFLYLKNSIGAATAPLTNYLVPILDQLIDKVVDVINKFNELTAVLTGADTWTQAIKYPIKWKDAADDANKAAKKLKSTMLGFDELNVIEPNSNGSGSADDSGLDYSRMFREVNVDAKVSWLYDKFDVFEPIKSAWENEGKKTLDSIMSTWAAIKSLVGSVGSSFATVWTNGTGQQTLEVLLQIVQNIVGTFGELATNIRLAWDEAGKGTRIVQSVWNILNNILKIFRDIWGKIKQWASGLNWNPLLESLANLFDAIDKITNPDSGIAKLLESVFENILLPVGKWVIEDGAPASVDALTGAFEALNVTVEALAIALEPVAELIGEIASFTFDNISGLLSGFGAVLSGESGGNISDDTASRIKKSNDKLKSNSVLDFLTGGYYSKWNKALEDFGANGFYDYTKNAEKFGANMPDFMEDFGESVADVGFFNLWKSGAGIKNKSGNEEAEQLSLDERFSAFTTQFNDDWSEKINTAMDNLSKSVSEKWAKIKSFPSEAMQSIKKDVVEKWDAIKSSLKSGWSELKDKVSGWKEHWGEKVSEWKNDASEKWETVKSDWKSGWGDIKGKVSDWKEHWSTKVSEWEQDASDKWDEIKNTLTESSAWQAITDKADDLKNAFGSAFQWVLEKAASFRDTFLNIVSFVWSGADGNGGIKGVVNNILGGVEGMINYTISGLNLFIDGVNELIAKASGVIASVGAVFGKDIPSVTGASIPHISEVGLPRLASGGIVDAGQLFIARESGAELVGQYRGKTGVVNNDQIVQSITDAVTDAFVMAFSAMKNSGENSVNEYRFYLSGRELTAEVEKIEREKGSPVLGGVVYG